MNKSEKRTGGLESVLTIVALDVFSAAFYMGIASFTVQGMIGFMIMHTIILSLAVIFVQKKLGFGLNRYQTCILVMLSLTYQIGFIFNRSLFGSTIVLDIFSMLIVLLYAWAAFEKADCAVHRLSIVLLCCGLLFFVIHFWMWIGCFSPDSYSYYEIAQTIGHKFGLIGTIRQYVMATDYNISFPYFYPLCVFVIDKIARLGIYSGILFNVYVTLLTGIVFLLVSRTFAKKSWCGCLAFFLLITARPYIDEVCAARAIPLAILLSTSMFFIIAKIFYLKQKKWSSFLLTGFIGGILISTRFDGVVMIGYSLLLVILCARKRVCHALQYLCGVALSALPQIIYSYIHFGKLWISDNSGTAFLVEVIGPTRIIMPGDGTLTLFNAPLTWMHALLWKAYGVGRSLLRCSLMADVCLLACIILIAVALLHKTKMPKNVVIALCITVIFYAGKTVMYALVGYEDPRYHLESVVLTPFVFMMACEKMKLVPSRTIFLRAFSFAEILALAFVSYRAGVMQEAYEARWDYVPGKISIAPNKVTLLDEELHNHITDKCSGILFLGNGYTFGGWTDWKVYAAPSSSEWKKVKYAMEHYMTIDYIVMPNDYTDLSEHIETETYWNRKNVVQHLNALYKRVELTDYVLYVMGESQ